MSLPSAWVEAPLWIIYTWWQSPSGTRLRAIEAKAVDINCVAGWHGHILSVSVSYMNFEWAKFCLENGALPNISKVLGYKLVIACSAEEGFQAMVELLLDFGAETPASGAIVLAAAAGQIEMVRRLLAKGADVNEIGARSPESSRLKDVGTPLHRAITNGHKEIAKLLIEKGANLKLRDWSGRTLMIHEACQAAETGLVV